MKSSTMPFPYKEDAILLISLLPSTGYFTYNEAPTSISSLEPFLSVRYAFSSAKFTAEKHEKGSAEMTVVGSG